MVSEDLVFPYPKGFYFKTMSCSGSNLGFLIDIEKKRVCIKPFKEDTSQDCIQIVSGFIRRRILKYFPIEFNGNISSNIVVSYNPGF